MNCPKLTYLHTDSGRPQRQQDRMFRGVEANGLIAWSQVGAQVSANDDTRCDGNQVAVERLRYEGE